MWTALESHCIQNTEITSLVRSEAERAAYNLLQEHSSDEPVKFMVMSIVH